MMFKKDDGLSYQKIGFFTASNLHVFRYMMLNKSQFLLYAEYIPQVRTTKSPYYNCCRW